jgi:tetratricopeptide (TPR) repeat protein
VYGKPVEEVEAALHEYFDASTVHAQLFDVQFATVDAPKIQPTASLPARLALAELLANRRGADEQARAAYDQLSKDYLDRWEVEEGRGQFAWQRRKLVDAEHHFRRAVELGCRNLPTLLLYARVLGYNDQTKDEAAVLHKAALLFPDSDEVNLELGAALVRSGEYSEAAAALLSVKKIGAGDQAYRLFYNLAYAQFRLGDRARARVNIDKARRYTKIPAVIADIDRLERALDRMDPAEPVELPSVEGTLEDMECGALARLHVRVEREVKIFVMPDPEKASISCGPQKPPRTLRLEYQAMPAMAGVAGLVRSLEFR